jgi:hypothetical protein
LASWVHHSFCTATLASHFQSVIGTCQLFWRHLGPP